MKKKWIIVAVVVVILIIITSAIVYRFFKKDINEDITLEQKLNRDIKIIKG